MYKLKLFSEILLLFGLLLSSAVPSQENAVWEVFTDRSFISHGEIIVSEDEKTVWVGTNGGLEQRDAATGELVRLFTTLDGLPSNSISALSFDLNGGLWIGTWNGVFAYRSVDDDWTVYDIENFGLPKHGIDVLSIDSSGGLWIG
ncbi:MAG: two-component regulator propeller domain-containing protein, partial [Pseudomonadota bacterium]